MGRYDVGGVDDDKQGGCCRSDKVWGWKRVSKLDLGSSALGWSASSRSYALLIVRALFSVWSLGILIAGFVLQGNATFGNGVSGSPWWTWFAYLGNWAYVSLMIYFFCATYFSWRDVSGGALTDTHKNPFEFYHWVNYEMAWALAWGCTFGYWFVIRTECTFGDHDCSLVTVFEMHAYGINLLWLLIEIFFHQLQFQFVHVMFVWIFGICWFIFSAIWHGVTDTWLYSAQDEAQAASLSFFFYPIVLLALTTFHFCGFGWNWVLGKWYKNVRRVAPEDFFDNDPTRLGSCC